MKTTPSVINLYEEWAKRRYREVRLAKLWFTVLALSLLVGVGTLVLLAWELPRALRLQALWQARAEKAQNQPEPIQEPPLPKELFTHARLRTLEFNLVVLALTRLAPRHLYLNEVRLTHEQEQGLVIAVRGYTLGFQPIQDYTERLKATQLFSEITPLSLNRQEAEQNNQWSYFEMRLILPSQDSAAPKEGGTSS